MVTRMRSLSPNLVGSPQAGSIPIHGTGGAGSTYSPPGGVRTVADGNGVNTSPTRMPTSPLQPFAPGNDLRFTQINPVASDRTSGIMGKTLSAFNGVMDGPAGGGISAGSWDERTLAARQRAEAALNSLTKGAAINPEISDRLGGFRALTTQAATALRESPDRIQMVRDALSDFDLENQPKLAAAHRDVGRKAAALGRIGSGVTTSELGDVQSAYDRNRLLTQNALIRDAVEGDVRDRFGRLSAFQGLEAQTQGLEEALRNESRRERDYSTNFDFGRTGLMQQAAAAAANENLGERGLQLSAAQAARNYDLARIGLGQSMWGQSDSMDRLDRDELRGERGYQYGVGRDARSDRVQDTILQDQLLNSQFGRYATAAGMGNPGQLAGYLGGAAQTQYGQAGGYYGDVGNLAGEYGYRTGGAAGAPQQQVARMPIQTPMIDPMDPRRARPAF